MSFLEGKVALVTGASRGIGRATALMLASRGADVAINYKTNSTAAEEVRQEIEKLGRQCAVFQADVADFSQATSLVQQAVQHFGRLDILVNNAGLTRDNLIVRLSEEDWDVVVDTILKGAFACSRAAVRQMMRQRYGRIINIGSISGLGGNAGQTNYAAAKAGLIGLTKALAKEVGSRGITVNLIAPGFIETDLTASLPQDMVAEILRLTPLGRLGKPEDVAAAVCFLASDEASFITGQVLSVDGGLLMQ